MARLPKPTLAALVAAVWLAGLFLPGALSDNVDVQVALLFALTLVAGIVAGTWWILSAPWLAAVVLLVTGELFPDTTPCTECRDELGTVGNAILTAIVCMFAFVVLAIGVGLRRGAAFARRTSTGAG